MKFSPDAARVKELEETGTRFARQLLQSQKRAQRRSAGGLSESRSDPAVLALGRVIGSLCVLTTRKAELSGAMVASGVSQASFSPQASPWPWPRTAPWKRCYTRAIASP